VNTPQFRNVILCDDIREEAGNKKSLMGVFAGDIQVPAFPANIHLAIYAEYVNEGPSEEVTFELRLFQDETEIVKFDARAKLPVGAVGILAVPRAIVLFEKACTLRLVAGKPGTADRREIVSKTVSLPPIST
jgi:hypothetical protein